MSDTPRAYTEEEAREHFLDCIRSYVTYWSEMPDSKLTLLPGEPNAVTARLRALAFGILNIIDGTNASLPSFDLVLSPHPSDKEYHIERGENWYEPGMVINTGYMHDEWYKKGEADEL